jgi:hypothetical protein
VRAFREPEGPHARQNRAVGPWCAWQIEELKPVHVPGARSAHWKPAATVIGRSACSKCRIYIGTMVFVRRKEVLVDALRELPAERRQQLRKSESKLIEFLD